MEPTRSWIGWPAVRGPRRLNRERGSLLRGPFPVATFGIGDALPIAMASPSSERILAQTAPPRPRDIVSALADDTGKIEARMLESLLDAPLDDTLVGSSSRMQLLVAQSAKSDPPTSGRTFEPPSDPYGKGSIPTPRVSSAAELQAWLAKAPPPYSSSDTSPFEDPSRETLPEIPVTLPASSSARRVWPSLVVGALLVVAIAFAYAWLNGWG
jgi:hypothetical protein